MSKNLTKLAICMWIVHTHLKSHKSPCWLRHFSVKSGKKQSINDIFHSPFSTKMRRQRTVLSDSTKSKKTLLSVSLLQSGVERERAIKDTAAVVAALEQSCVWDCTSCEQSLKKMEWIWPSPDNFTEILVKNKWVQSLFERIDEQKWLPKLCFFISACSN